MKRGFENMDVSKRGQVFLFAAVVISAILLSVGTVSNIALVSEEPQNLEKLTMEVKRETGKVIDYEIRDGWSEDYSKIEDFVVNFSKDLRDQDPNLNFMFIYGNSSEVFLKNYGSKAAQICINDNPGNCEDILGASQLFESRIYHGGGFTDVTFANDDVNLLWEASFNEIDLGDSLDKINITIFDENHIFNFGDSRQVIFVVQKEVGDENFVSVM
ncbi:hypothetical protein HN876_02710 [archaeon]|jgi:hypothetical protein|nr:hypothetical protein [archaeon]MBT6182965.1 hypothetical protein [archaeon]MBT6606570.1 hypothetical protein [archaeon]MBT7251803.1 hypothetical protein [archaeon]